MKSREISAATGGAFDITVGPLADAWGFGPGKKSGVDKRIIDSLLEFTGYELVEMQDEELFKTKIKAKIHILAGKLDYTVPNWWVVEFAKAQQATIEFFQDDHSFTQNIGKLPNIIRNILDEKH